MSQLILTHRSTLRRRRARSSSSIRDHFQVGQIALMFTLLILIAVLSFLYLAQFSKVATKGYEVTRLEVERNKLMTEREALNVQVAEQRSLNSFLEEGSPVAHMIQDRDASFFTPITPVASLE